MEKFRNDMKREFILERTDPGYVEGFYGGRKGSLLDIEGD